MLIPAFCPSGGVTALSFVGANYNFASANAVPTVTLPAGSASGDLCVMMLGIGTSASSTVAGFTTIAADTSGARQNILLWKLLTAADITAGTVRGNASTVGGQRIQVLVFRPDKPIKAVSVRGVNHIGTTSNPPAQTIAASGGSPPLVCIGGFYSSGGSPTGSGTLWTTGTQDPTSSISTLMAHRIFNSNPIDLTWDIGGTIRTQNMLESCYIEVV